MFLFVRQQDFLQFRPFTSVKLSEVQLDGRLTGRLLNLKLVVLTHRLILSFFFLLLALSAGRFGNSNHLNHIIIGIINYIQHHQTLPFF